MKQITIQIRIGGRTYPAQIPLEGEEVVRKAAKELEIQMQIFANQFPGIDIQDQLALTALNVQSRLMDIEGAAERAIAAVECSLQG